MCGAVELYCQIINVQLYVSVLMQRDDDNAPARRIQNLNVLLTFKLLSLYREKLND